ncbi:hypothetical protein EPN96_02770 [bacterium]|nr:MAG: hypothetical protein EPN96_02770 [bacterium]
MAEKHTASEGIDALEKLSKEELVKIILDDAKNWLAHDGLWFQAVESAHGMEAAIHADTEAWRRFSPIEARRIMDRLGIKPGGGIPALKECLRHRMYARLNVQECVDTDASMVFRMVECRVQSARARKGLEPFPCKAVGIVEYSEFAKAVDPRLRAKCVACPPDKGERDFMCAWEFILE